jgi:hypothetical protein
MKRFCILLTAILLSSVLNAQQTRWFKTSDPTVTVSGVITDEITGEGIQFASVVANEEGFNYAISDSDGRYSINVIPGEVELSFNSVSYKKEKINISTETDTTVNCVLMPYEPQTVFRSYVPKRFEFDARFFNTLGITNVMDAAQTSLVWKDDIISDVFRWM